MTLIEFQSFVQQNSEWFAGVHPETNDSVDAAELQLGRTLPSSLRWLLTHYGYSDSCGIDALDEAVEITLRTREAIAFPDSYIILNDWHDVGVVFLDSSNPNKDHECPIYWTSYHHLLRLIEGVEMDEDVDRFPDYPAWVMSRLQLARDTK